MVGIDGGINENEMDIWSRDASTDRQPCLTKPYSHWQPHPYELFRDDFQQRLTALGVVRAYHCVATTPHKPAVTQHLPLNIHSLTTLQHQTLESPVSTVPHPLY